MVGVKSLYLCIHEQTLHIFFFFSYLLHSYLLIIIICRKGRADGQSLFVGRRLFESRISDMIAHSQEITHWVSAEVLCCGSQKVSIIQIYLFFYLFFLLFFLFGFDKFYRYLFTCNYLHIFPFFSCLGFTFHLQGRLILYIYIYI